MERLTKVQAAVQSIRDAVTDFIELFAVEGRIASLSLVRLVVLGITAGIFCVVAWLFFCLAAVAALVSAYHWGWPYALLLLAVVHIVVAAAMIAFARKAAANAFFPTILSHIRSRSRHGHYPKPHHDLAELEKERVICDRALTHAKFEAAERIAETKQALRTTLTSPGVLAGAVGLGAALAFLRRRNKTSSRAMGPGTGPSLGSMLARQLTGLIAARIVAAIMDRAQRRKASWPGGA